MPAAIAIPMLIGTGVSAATSIAAAKMGSNAAKSAAQTQANSANQAMQYQQQMFNQIAPFVQQQAQASAQNFAPYQQMGGAALQALYQRLGLNPGMGQSAVPQMSMMPQMPQVFDPRMAMGQVKSMMGQPMMPPQMPGMGQPPTQGVQALRSPYMTLPGPQRQGG